MARVNWMSVIATLTAVASVVLLVLGQTDEAAVGAQLAIASAILAHLR